MKHSKLFFLLILISLSQPLFSQDLTCPKNSSVYSNSNINKEASVSFLTNSEKRISTNNFTGKKLSNEHYVKQQKTNNIVNVSNKGKESTSPWNTRRGAIFVSYSARYVYMKGDFDGSSYYVVSIAGMFTEGIYLIPKIDPAYGTALSIGVIGNLFGIN